MEFFDQFINRPDPEPWPGYPDDIFTPVEGFTGEHVESLSHLVRRLEAGEYVGELDDGLTLEDQVFRSEYMDPFDVMDYAQNVEVVPTPTRIRPTVHDSGLAAPEEPSLDSGADKPGNQETV